MPSLDTYLDEQLAKGRRHFLWDDALTSLPLSTQALASAIKRQVAKRRLAAPRHGFYLILRPEDQPWGAPDPVRWIDPLMRFQEVDYRVSLLRAAAFHGASHQAAMVFQVVTPKQLRALELGRHRVEFIYQSPSAFVAANVPEYLGQIKSPTGFAKVAGIELTMLDCVRYFHRAGGINAVAQIVKDLGSKGKANRLAKLAVEYENSAVRRLGYLLGLSGHERQATALRPFVAQAKSMVPLDPSFKPLVESDAEEHQKDLEWKLVINEPVQADS
jgi:hypothetical protein